MKPQILVVDDDSAHRQMLEAVLNEEGYEVSHAADGAEAVAAVEKRFYDLVLLDIRMAPMGGIEALKKIKEISPGIAVIIMTAYASVGTAVEALKSGAYDYLTKPLDIDELKILVKKTLRHFQLETENRYLKERISDKFDYANIIGQSPPMKKLFETLSLVAPSDATALILGESGTGKELVANAIHQNSPRKDSPFIKVNCAALPETLLESELFGHEKGAFTGALTRKQGRFRQAHTGTIFLDEIAEMSHATQAKILRVLQEQSFEPLGDSTTVQVDIRVVAATNRVLEDEIEKGRFRQDLYYRLNVVSLHIAPLRERREDIVLLAEHFLKIYNEKNRRMIKGFSPRASDLLMRYHWPGNVRELENAVERAVILARGEIITPDQLPEPVRGTDGGAAARGEGSGATAGRALKDVEKDMILRTLDQMSGNRTKTADILGISRRALQLKLKKYGINE
ncbi:MAG: sigma-54-dependent transcriptional regulator [Desulfosalsimonas sp.]